MRTQGWKGDDGSHKACPPPPLQRDWCRASCLRRACVVPATCVQRRDEDKASPPTHTPRPPQGWGMKVGRGGQRPPPPRTKQQGGEAAYRGCGTDHTTVPVGSTRRASLSRGGHRGCERKVVRATTGATRQALPPLQRDKCRASCLRRACDVLTPEDGQRGRPPPPPPSPPPTQERGEDSEGTARGHGGGAEDRPKRPGERRVALAGLHEKKEKTDTASCGER